MSTPPRFSSLPKRLREGLYTTIVLASNIHCPSCNARIQDALDTLEVADVSVNTASGEVRVVHPNKRLANHICQILADESYEPYSVTIYDPSDRIISEKSFSKSNSWFRCMYQSKDAATARKQHMRNCKSCRIKGFKTLSQDTRTKTTRLLDNEADDEHNSRVAPDATGVDETSEESVTPPDQKSSISQRWKLVLSVGGMTCASCTGSVNEAVKTMDKVTSVKVELLSNSCVVEYTGPEDYAEDIRNAIDEKGYEAEITERQQILEDERVLAKLSIGGMTCTACEKTIKDGLEKLPYVLNVKVSHMTNSAEVELSTKDHLEAIKDEVDSMGHDCEIDSWEYVGSKNYRNSPLERTVDIKVTGMFCDKCPDNIQMAIKTRFRGAVKVSQKSDWAKGIVTVQYTPSPPDFTIRSIIATIEDASESFKAEIYHPPTIEERSRKMQARERKRILMRLISSGLAAIPTLLIGVVWMDLDTKSAAYRYFAGTMFKTGATRGDWTLFILATIVYFYGADLFHTRAFKELKSLWRPGSRTPILKRFYRFGSMNLLISAGTTVAYLASIAQLIMDSAESEHKSPRDSEAGQDDDGATYFDAVVFLTFFILIGRFLEAFSKSKTSDAVSELGKLKPNKAIIQNTSRSTASGTGSLTIDADLLEVGDRVIIPSGNSPPADGIVIQGDGKFDERSLTGESRPVSKTIGDEVFTGTIAQDPFTIEVTKIGGASMLDQIVSVVREGLGKRAPVERYADILTSYFVPVITAIAILTWLVWLIVAYSGALDRMNIPHEKGGWAFWCLNFAIAVFVTACPCGIGLAAPTALFAGIGIAAKLGILVQGGGEAFQEAPYLDAIVFDKTGTLTEGDIKVSDHQILTENEDKQKEIWGMVKSLEEQSGHPIAKAVVDLASEMQRHDMATDSIDEIPGRGLRGAFTNTQTGAQYEAAIGSQKHIQELQSESRSDSAEYQDVLSQWQNEAKSVAVFAMRQVSEAESRWTTMALFATSDPVRSTAAPTIRTLRKRGLKVFMLSGDHPVTALAVGSSLGIETSNIFAGVLPTEKADKIEELKRTLNSKPPEAQYRKGSDLEAQRKSRGSDEANKPASVAFVGDGINDAPALLASSLSISMGTGAQVAMNSSQFILLQPDLSLIPRLMDLSKLVYRRIKINFGWALVYNVVLVPVAAGVLFGVKAGGWRLGPVWASLAMALSSLSVVMSSLALKWEGAWRFSRK